MLHDGAVTIVKRHEYHIRLNNEDIINLLRGIGHNVPDNAQVIVRVPGGGD